MLFILIPIAWLTVVAFFVAICRMAARGDAMLAPVADRSTRMPVDGLVVWEDLPDMAPLEDERGHKIRRRRLPHHRILHHGIR